MMEQGPFKPNSNGTLSLNKYSWNTVSNMIFIEQPVGVGFSFSDDKSDYSTGDVQATLDNYLLIQAFFDKFPEYRKNDLYISSESYGGHYMPELAKKIVESNSIEGNAKLNFKGFAVGNAYTDPYSGFPAMVDTLWGHQVLSKPSYDNYLRKCRNNPLPNIRECFKINADMIVNEKGALNPYGLDYPLCNEESPAKYGRA